MGSATFMIKICGVTREVDAQVAVQYGANALGFNFFEASPRFVEPERALAIMELLPAWVLTVGVTVAGRPIAEELPAKLTRRLGMIQVHGVAAPSELPHFPDFTGRILVATGPGQVRLFREFEVLVDTSWGKGVLTDWSLLEGSADPFILSGGLDAGNVAAAIRRLRPCGVDVCSGVEASPGIKDPVQLRRFLRAVRAGLTTECLAE